MGESAHLSPEALSAFLDRELSAAEAASARAHLGSCAACAGDLAQFDRLDAVLASPAPLGCAAAAVVLSARLDREADAAEVALAEHHLLACAGCRGRVASWAAAEALLAGPIFLPPARVDAAMAALVRAPAAPRGPRTSPPRGLPVRAGLGGLAAAALAVALGLALPLGGVPDEARFDSTLVASVQTVVFDPRSNTYYVAEPETGTVAAFDAATNVLRTRISVGGRPTALALHSGTGTIYALDPERKTLTEISIALNAVVVSSPLAMSGTPTSLHVDEAAGTVTVASAVAPAATAQPRASGAPTGYVAVFNVATRRVDSVRPVGIAIRELIFDDRGARAAFVSADATTIVDPTTYAEIARLPGGVAAAYATGASDLLAIVASQDGGTRVHFSGTRAPDALQLEGAPRSIIALPDGEFGILVDLGTRSRIVILDRSGRETTALDVAKRGHDLAYDAGSKRFTVAGPDGIAFASPSLAVVPSPTAPAPGSSAPPASPQPSPTVTAAPSPAPSGPATPSTPSAVSLPATPSVPRTALRIGDDIYRVPIPGGRSPRLVSVARDRMWYVDSGNALSALNLESAELFTFAYFPSEVNVTLLAAGTRFVYAIDPVGGQLFVLSVADERLTPISMPFVRGALAAAVTADDRLWVTAQGNRYLFSYEPLTRRVETRELKADVTGLAASGARLWLLDQRAQSLGVLDTTAGSLEQTALPELAKVTALEADRLGRLWIGTLSGEVYVAQDGKVRLARRGLTPVTALAVDAAGRAWHLTGAPGADSSAYERVDGSFGRVVPGPGNGLAFTSAGRAWIADTSGGFFLALETSR